MSIFVRNFDQKDHEICELILRSLPEWFGIEDAILGYSDDIKNHKTFVAERDGEVIGFITLILHNLYTAEVQVMAVSTSNQRSGVGSLLLNYSESYLKENNYKLFEVKTLGMSSRDEYYKLTRNFYLKNRFYPLEENLQIWGEDNPCLIMVKSLEV